MNKRQVAENILNRLESRRFAEWYNEGGRFDDYISCTYPVGHPKHNTKEEILREIETLFKLD